MNATKKTYAATTIKGRIMNVLATTEEMAKAKIRREIELGDDICTFWTVGEFWDEIGNRVNK